MLNMTPLGWLGRKTSTQTNSFVILMKFKVLFFFSEKKNNNKTTLVCRTYLACPVLYLIKPGKWRVPPVRV